MQDTKVLGNCCCISLYTKLSQKVLATYNWTFFNERASPRWQIVWFQLGTHTFDQLTLTRIWIDRWNHLFHCARIRLMGEHIIACDLHSISNETNTIKPIPPDWNRWSGYQKSSY